LSQLIRTAESETNTTFNTNISIFVKSGQQVQSCQRGFQSVCQDFGSTLEGETNRSLINTKTSEGSSRGNVSNPGSLSQLIQTAEGKSNKT